MCVIEKLTGIHITTKDKFDLSVSLISLADCIWVLGEISVNPIHFYHYMVIPLLLTGTLLSLRVLYKMIKRHHFTWKEKQAKKAIDLLDRVPQTKASEK